MYKIWLLVLSFVSSGIAFSQVSPENLPSESFLDEATLSPYDLATKLNNQNSTNNLYRSTQRFQLDSIKGFNPKTEPQGSNFHWAFVYRYDETRNRETSFSYLCEDLNCLLEPRSVITREYNSEDQQIGSSSAAWDGESYIHVFDLPHRIQLFYNNGLLVARLADETIRDTFIYNDQDLLIDFKSYIIDTSADTFRLFLGFEYTYNDSNLLETIIQSRSSSSGEELSPAVSTHFSYYDTGQLLAEEEFFRESMPPHNWHPFFLRNYTYNPDGTIDIEGYYDVFRPDLDSIWRYQESREHVYSAEGELDEIFYYTTIDNGDPTLAFKSEYTYDRSVTLDDVRLPRGNIKTEGQKHMILSEHHFGITPHIIGLSPTPFSRDYFYIARNTSATSAPEALQTSVSPNPVQDKLHLVLEEAISQPFRLSIHDTAGRPHLELHSNDTRIDVSLLPAGTYVYTIHYLGKTGSGKFVKL